MSAQKPRLVVFSSLYPSAVRPNAGVFIRERMSKVATQCPLVVVSPVPWFPFQSLIRYWRPNYRPQPDLYENQHGLDVYFPRFLALPGVGRRFDGISMAMCSYFCLRRLNSKFKFNIIDAHFAYPDGYAATLLGKWFDVPTAITLRGTEVPLSQIPVICKLLIKALKDAAQVFSVSESLKSHVVDLGVKPEKVLVVGNGVDLTKFFPIDKLVARRRLGLSEVSKVLISVGGLVPRKGFHRVIEVLPELIRQYPDLIYLVVGGASPEGDMRSILEQQVKALGLANHVRFLGALDTKKLHVPLSAADVFVLATANEGWANVFLEAMACGLPVVTTDVGGNREVVCRDELGFIVPFSDPDALTEAINTALKKPWDTRAILDYAAANEWDGRVTLLSNTFNKLVLS